MPKRKPGYYWIVWSEHADPALAAHRPGPLIGQWDGTVWWLIRTDVYRFDCEVEVLGSTLSPPRRSMRLPLADRAVPRHSDFRLQAEP